MITLCCRIRYIILSVFDRLTGTKFCGKDVIFLLIADHIKPGVIHLRTEADIKNSRSAIRIFRLEALKSIFILTAHHRIRHFYFDQIIIRILKRTAQHYDKCCNGNTDDHCQTSCLVQPDGTHRIDPAGAAITVSAYAGCFLLLLLTQKRNNITFQAG